MTRDGGALSAEEVAMAALEFRCREEAAEPRPVVVDSDIAIAVVAALVSGRQTEFGVMVQLDGPPPNLRETRGQLQIEGQRRSLLVEGGKHLAAVVMRESGF